METKKHEHQTASGFDGVSWSANLALDQTREAPQIKTALPQIRVYFKPPSHCCQRCGENIGWIGRFLFGWAHKCEAPDSQNESRSATAKAGAAHAGGGKAVAE